jgi:hypothetical protein
MASASEQPPQRVPVPRCPVRSYVTRASWRLRARRCPTWTRSAATDTANSHHRCTYACGHGIAIGFEFLRGTTAGCMPAHSRRHLGLSPAVSLRLGALVMGATQALNRNETTRHRIRERTRIITQSTWPTRRRSRKCRSWNRRAAAWSSPAPHVLVRQWGTAQATARIAHRGLHLEGNDGKADENEEAADGEAARLHALRHHAREVHVLLEVRGIVILDLAV